MSIFDGADGDSDGRLSREDIMVFDRLVDAAARAKSEEMLEGLRQRCDFSEMHQLDGELAATFVFTFADKILPVDTSIPDLVELARHMNIKHQQTAEYMEVNPKVFAWLEQLFRFSDFDESNTINDAEASFMVMLAMESLDGVVLFGGYPGDDDEGNGHYSILEGVPVVESHYEMSEVSDEEVWPEKTKRAAEGLLEEMDVDGNGAISRAEFLSSAVSADPSFGALPYAKEIFGRFDSNGDGHLDVAEISRLVNGEGLF